MGKYDEIVEESVESQQPMSILSAPGEPNDPTTHPLITLLVKVSDTDIRSILVDPASEIVGNLKTKLFPKEMQENKYIRLIFGGRVLVDPHLISLYKLTDKCVIHGFVTDALVDEQPGSSRTMLRRQQARGLDKLEESGFTVDDIHGMKFHFHAMCVYSGINKDTEEEKVALEEKWLEGKLPIINASPDDRTRIQLNYLHEKGDGLSFILGFLTGVLLSFLSLFVIKHVKLNELQKFGTRLGLVLSLPIFVFVLVMIFTGEM